MKEQHIKTSLGIFFGILTACTMVVVATLIQLSVGVHSEVLVFFRNFLGLLIIFPIVYFKKIPFTFSLVKANFIRAIMGLGAMYCYFFALQHLSLVDAVLLQNTIPLFVPLVLWFWMKKKIRHIRMFPLLIGFIGVLIILKPTRGILDWYSVIGLTSGLLGAIALVGVKELTRTQSSLSILFYYFVISSAISFIPSIVH